MALGDAVFVGVNEAFDFGGVITFLGVGEGVCCHCSIFFPMFIPKRSVAISANKVRSKRVALAI